MRTIHPSSLLIILIPLLLFLSMIRGIPFSSHFDEAAAVFCTIVLIVGMLFKRKGSFIRKDMFLIIGMILIAFMSNIINQIVTTPSYIFNDLGSFLRIFLVYFGTTVAYEIYPNSIERVIKVLGKASFFFIIISFFFGILNLLGIVNMYNATRYGIRNYSFVFSNASQFGIFAGSALALYIITGKSKKTIEVLGLLVLLMTAKGTSLIIIGVFVVLNLILRGRIKWWHIVFTGIMLSFALRFQIEAYILNESAPRAILLYYGIMTAARFFPLGSGFATYGSNMAAVHYSPLYYEYGFHLRKALTIFDTETGTGTYLNDTYLGMVIGEFGFVATLLFLVFVLRMWNRINKTSDIRLKSKQMIISLFVCLCGSFVMLGSIKNAPGQIIMFVLATYFAKNKKEGQKMASMRLK